MESKDLRIGNFYNEFGIPKQADPNLILKLYQIELSGKIAIDISPVPITEEWLLKFGFTIVPAPSAYGCDCNKWSEKYNLRGGWNGKSWFALEILNNYYHKEIQYVHQLQNLYFALTEEELW